LAEFEFLAPVAKDGAEFGGRADEHVHSNVSVRLL
jgi:hypothetical protein